MSDKDPISKMRKSLESLHQKRRRLIRSAWRIGLVFVAYAALVALTPTELVKAVAIWLFLACAVVEAYTAWEQVRFVFPKLIDEMVYISSEALRRQGICGAIDMNPATGLVRICDLHVDHPGMRHGGQVPGSPERTSWIDSGKAIP